MISTFRPQATGYVDALRPLLDAYGMDLAYHLPKRIFKLGRGGTPMTTITGFEVHDVRFPTAAAGDGSDSINRGDYSATYVELSTDAGVTGTGFTFTNGQGNEITCACVRALAPQIVGRTVAELTAEPPCSLTAHPQLRWLGPEKGALHMATGALLNAVWDLRAKVAGQPMWQLLASLPTDELLACVDFRHIDDALTPAEAAAILDQGRDGLPDRLTLLAKEGFPSYTTSVGWLGYPDEKVRELTRTAYAEGRRARPRAHPAGGRPGPGRHRRGRRQPGSRSRTARRGTEPVRWGGSAAGAGRRRRG